MDPEEAIALASWEGASFANDYRDGLPQPFPQTLVEFRHACNLSVYILAKLRNYSIVIHEV
jgi:hypothetical protein